MYSPRKLQKADEYSFKKYGVLISSLVIPPRSNLPTEGFFNRAIEFGIFRGANRAEFFKQHSEKVSEIIRKDPGLICLLG